MRNKKRFILLIGVILLMLALIIIPTFAHEGREVGEYELHFGWRVEPAIAGYPNGPEVFIHGHGEEGEEEEEINFDELEISLQVEVTFGPASRIINLRPQFGEPDHYIADMIPTRPGDYSFRLFGTIGEQAIDEVFSSADGGFSSVEPASDIQFPEPDPTVAELLARIEALEAQIADLTAE